VGPNLVCAGLSINQKEKSSRNATAFTIRREKKNSPKKEEENETHKKRFVVSYCDLFRYLFPFHVANEESLLTNCFDSDLCAD
jgi:hypothetical protein